MSDEWTANEAEKRRQRAVLRLGVLFGALYFIQGLAEPTTGLMNQPVLSTLKNRNFGSDEIGFFSFWLGMPWNIKPVYGLLSDFVPLLGSRRRNWLLATMALAATGFGVLAALPMMRDSFSGLLTCLLLVNLGVAFSDVVIDAVMIENGQPLNATGRLQSIQWASMMTAGTLAGVAGGWISHWGWTAVGFAFCSLAMFVSLGLCYFWIREPEGIIPKQDLGSVLRALWRTLQSRTLLASALFLFLWGFNPFSSDVLYLHLTEYKEFSEPTYGWLKSIESAAGIAASILYAVYCTRIQFVWLLHASVVLGILTTVAYVQLTDERSACIISAGVGFAYMTATMIQLDLAARICPPQVAGTTFAILMSVSNFATDVSRWVGGILYQRWTERWDPAIAFEMLVITGACSTALCWSIFPVLLRGHAAANGKRIA